MFVVDAIVRIVDFLRAGYPQGVPATDTFPVLAVLPHRLSYAEPARISRSGLDAQATA